MILRCPCNRPFSQITTEYAAKLVQLRSSGLQYVTWCILLVILYVSLLLKDHVTRENVSQINFCFIFPFSGGDQKQLFMALTLRIYFSYPVQNVPDSDPEK